MEATAMAEDGEDEHKADGSFSMRMTIKSLKMAWPKVKNITTEDLHSLIKTTGSAQSDRRVVLLDCRPEEEFTVSHLENAIRVDPNATASNVEETLKMLQENTENTNLPKEVVCYCSVGYRSCLYAQALQTKLKPGGQDEGSPQIRTYNLEGSLFKWANEGRPLVDMDNKPTIYAHPYNALWGKLLRADLRRSQPL